ncbi:unnamed protein product [Urochloa humidicola]
MPWFPAVPPSLAAADGGRIRKRGAGLPRLLQKLFIKVLRLRPASAAEAEFYGGYRMDGLAGGEEEEYCYYYSYGGAGSSWVGVLSSIPEEDYDDSDSSEEESTLGGGGAVLRKAQSERFVVAGTPDAAAAVMHVEVLL